MECKKYVRVWKNAKRHSVILQMMLLKVFTQAKRQGLNNTNPSGINVLMEDFNAKVGCGQRGDCVGRYGLGITNEHVDRSAQFCQEEDLIITNTFYQQPPRR